MKQRKLIRWMVFSFLIIFFMVVCTCTGIVPGVVITARADDGDSVYYISKEWDETSKSVMDVECRCENFTELHDYNSNMVNWDEGWYVVTEDITYSDRIVVNNTVNLILCDGVELRASEGINVEENSTLNIYGQTSGSGKLIATGAYQAAGIGGDTFASGGTVTIYGGEVTAIGGSGDLGGAGIGGGAMGAGNTVTIYGGKVTATGGSGNVAGAGIGGGAACRCGTVTIYGGEVAATGGDNKMTSDNSEGIGHGTYGDIGILTLGNGVKLETSYDGLTWEDTTTTPDIRTRYMRTSYSKQTTYTVTLDNQSATTAGAKSVEATYGQVLTSIEGNLPEKADYTFGGYFTETNGGGTQYLNADGTPTSAIWTTEGNGTLYAKWTAADNSKPDAKGTDSSSADVNKVPSGTPIIIPSGGGEHTHKYEWETIKPTEEIDGELRYQCETCGDIKESVPLTAYNVFNKTTTEKIRNAKKDATVKIETNKWISFHKMVMEALAERPDVTLEISFLDEGYKGKRCTVVIPKGIDTKPLVDKNGFTGFLFLGGKFGMKTN